jgi:hypothetical protein
MSDQASARVTPVSPAAISAKKLRANRRNARRSTGPRTREGKAVACRNATTHGLFCRDLVLPGEEEDRFHLLRESILRALKPQDAMELALVDRLVCDQWRLNRLQRAEMALYAHRDVQLREHRRNEIAKLDRDFRFTDAASACHGGLHAAKEYARYRELQEQLEAQPAPAAVLAAALLSDDPAFERLSRYEQRLQHGVHHCLRDLHALRAKAEKYRDLPESPFLAREEEVMKVQPDEAEPQPPGPPIVEPSTPGDAPIVQNEPTALHRAATPRPAAGYASAAPQPPLYPALPPVPRDAAAPPAEDRCGSDGNGRATT